MDGGAAKTSAEVIAIDGKTVRRSYQKKGAEEPTPIVSAFAARQRMALGQIKVGEKFNEIDRRHSRAARPVGDRRRRGDDRRHGPAR